MSNARFCKQPRRVLISVVRLFGLALTTNIASDFSAANSLAL